MKPIIKISVIGILILGTAIYLPSCMKDTTPIPPVVITTNVSDISTTSASAGGILEYNGGAEVTDIGVCWSTSPNPTTSSNKITIGEVSIGNYTGSFTGNITELTANTKYYVRAYATNNVGTAYGSEISFSTEELPANPEVTTSAINSITSFSAVSGGTVLNIQNDFLIESGVCWSTSPNPTRDNSKTMNVTYSGVFFTANLTGLTPGTTYYVRAYALYGTEFDNDILYGNELSFTTRVTGDLPGKIGSFSAASFSIGNKLYLGLGVKDFWEWDQTTNVWTRKADYPGNSSGVAVSFSIGTKGYIGFGNDIIDGLTNEFWEYDPSTNSWTQKASLPKSRGMAVGFSIGTKGYIGTGYKDSYTDNYPGLTYRDFWEWDQATNTWTQKANFGGIARFGAVGFSIGDKGYIGIGSGDGNNQLNDFWEWDQAKDIWTKKADFGGISRLRAVGFSIGNKGYIGTGTDDGTTLYKDFWEWDQASDTWLKKEDFGGNARGGAVGFSIGNNGYIGAGGTGSTYLDSTFQDFWEWNQPIDTWTKKTDIPGVGR